MVLHIRMEIKTFVFGDMLVRIVSTVFYDTYYNGNSSSTVSSNWVKNDVFEKKLKRKEIIFVPNQNNSSSKLELETPLCRLARLQIHIPFMYFIYIMRLQGLSIDNIITPSKPPKNR